MIFHTMPQELYLWPQPKSSNCNEANFYINEQNSYSTTEMKIFGNLLVNIHFNSSNIYVAILFNCLSKLINHPFIFIGHWFFRYLTHHLTHHLTHPYLLGCLGRDWPYSRSQPCSTNILTNEGNVGGASLAFVLTMFVDQWPHVSGAYVLAWSKLINCCC